MLVCGAPRRQEESKQMDYTGFDTAWTRLATQWTAYWADAAFRGVATMHALQERAANAARHDAAGMPPVLHFESEPVADAHEFPSPCNYRLLKITRCGTDHLERHVRADVAPVIVVDPRAGHGPGIGGFRRDSEVGMAMREGHPVYFVVFDPEPVEGQTLGAVIDALGAFIDLVAARHPATPPIVYGNCQGGWASAMALAHCDRQAGLLVLNGSPLSYWAGEPGVNPMRLLGGLLGGIWAAHWLADMGGDRFDGAWLVQNFEALRPEGVWTKYQALWAAPEREHDRFLDFERWWNGFYFLAGEEIVEIVRELFVGDRLEQGQVVVNGHCRADLRRIRAPLVVFSSWGDNITPPHQALGWLRAVYPSTEALVQAGQTVVYLTHEAVGHLGIFVSAEVARREHRAILHHAARIAALAPGLYEMRLTPPRRANAAPSARFEPRELEDLPFDPVPSGFEQVRQLSHWLDSLYGVFVSPAVRAAAAATPVRLFDQLHPMRASRTIWSAGGPALAALLPLLRDAMRDLSLGPGREANPFYAGERAGSDLVHAALVAWRECRDNVAELAFSQLYGNGDPPNP